ncbi:hypothetical protein SUGI_1005110 [Cryptomeria japonica]|nr:hypothetical protein SUGI_1005110 [Cryptomeria japonica]
MLCDKEQYKVEDEEIMRKVSKSRCNLCAKTHDRMNREDNVDSVEGIVVDRNVDELNLVSNNVGYLRAVLGTRDQDNSLTTVLLMLELIPNLPREAEQIRQCKGKVFALHDEPEVACVWLPNHDSPGLAMARVFGDFSLRDFGLITKLDISYHCLTKKDKFVRFLELCVILSDGPVMAGYDFINTIVGCYAHNGHGEEGVKLWNQI